MTDLSHYSDFILPSRPHVSPALKATVFDREDEPRLSLTFATADDAEAWASAIRLVATRMRMAERMAARKADPQAGTIRAPMQAMEVG